MRYELVRAHIPYRQVFKRPPPKRALWNNWFVEEMDLAIATVDPDDAPVAYEVHFATSCGYPIRSYLNDLWWPIGGDYNYILHPEMFAAMLLDPHPETLILLDPAFLGCTEQRPLCPFPETYRRVGHDWNNIGNQQAVAHRGASTTMFCGGGTFVRGGEPVFYALPSDHLDDKTLSLVIGVSDPKREADGTSRSVPGPTLSARMSSARRGFAFDIEEIDDAMRDLAARGYAVERTYGIDVLSERQRPAAAPLICARELARHLLVESEKQEPLAAHLRRQVPVVGDAAKEDADADLCVEALRQLCASKDPHVAFGFRKEVRAAFAILQRVKRFSPDDEAALDKLGPG